MRSSTVCTLRRSGLLPLATVSSRSFPPMRKEPSPAVARAPTARRLRTTAWTDPLLTPSSRARAEMLRVPAATRSKMTNARPTAGAGRSVLHPDTAGCSTALIGVLPSERCVQDLRDVAHVHVHPSLRHPFPEMKETPGVPRHHQASTRCRDLLELLSQQLVRDLGVRQVVDARAPATLIVT